MNNQYRVTFFRHPETGRTPVRDYLSDLPTKERAKISKYIEFLRESYGVLDEPYSRHLRGKIRELRVDFGKNRHRICYFTLIGKNIILLHAFKKTTAKTPEPEINRALENFQLVINNKHLYE